MRNNLKQFLFNIFSYRCTWLTLGHVIAFNRNIKDRSISPAIHHDEFKVGTHRTGWHLILVIGITVDDFIGLYTTFSKFTHPVDSIVFIVEVVQTWVRIGATVNPSSRIGDCRLLITRERHCLIKTTT